VNRRNSRVCQLQSLVSAIWDLTVYEAPRYSDKDILYLLTEVFAVQQNRTKRLASSPTKLNTSDMNALNNLAPTGRYCSLPMVVLSCATNFSFHNTITRQHPSATASPQEINYSINGKYFFAQAQLTLQQLSSQPRSQAIKFAHCLLLRN